MLQEKHRHREIPRGQRLINRPPLSRLFTASVKKDRDRRDQAIRAAHVQHGYSLTEIAAQLGLHYSSISRIAKRLEQSVDKDE
jgi:REP-associated tyrosine transposase